MQNPKFIELRKKVCLNYFVYLATYLVLAHQKYFSVIFSSTDIISLHPDMNINKIFLKNYVTFFTAKRI